MQEAESRPTPQDSKIAEDLPNEHFMQIKDAAALLDMSEIHIRRAFDAGHIPGIKLGGTSRVSRPFVNALLAEVGAGRRIVVEEFTIAWAATVEVAAS